MATGTSRSILTLWVSPAAKIACTESWRSHNALPACLNAASALPRKQSWQVAENFFSMLKTEGIKRRMFKIKGEARAELLNNIEFFYDPNRRQGNNNDVPPMEHEKLHFVNAISCLEN